MIVVLETSPLQRLQFSCSNMLLTPGFSLRIRPHPLTVMLLPNLHAVLTVDTSLLHGIGGILESRLFSAQRTYVNMLLRTYYRMAASKPTS